MKKIIYALMVFLLFMSSPIIWGDHDITVENYGIKKVGNTVEAYMEEVDAWFDNGDGGEITILVELQKGQDDWELMWVVGSDGDYDKTSAPDLSLGGDFSASGTYDSNYDWRGYFMVEVDYVGGYEKWDNFDYLQTE